MCSFLVLCTWEDPRTKKKKCVPDRSVAFGSVGTVPRGKECGRLSGERMIFRRDEGALAGLDGRCDSL